MESEESAEQVPTSESAVDESPTGAIHAPKHEQFTSEQQDTADAKQACEPGNDEAAKPAAETEAPKQSTDEQDEKLDAGELEDEKAEKRNREEVATEEPDAKKARRESCTPETPAEPSGETGLRRSGRERKAVKMEGFISSPKEGNGDAEGGPTIVNGRGAKLGSIKEFVANFNKVKVTDPVIRKLYKALYKEAGNPANRKNEIFEWSGLQEGDDEQDFISDLASACTLSELQEIGKMMFGLTSGSDGKQTKKSWCEAIGMIVVNPQPDSIRRGVASGGENVHGGRGRGPSGYQIYCSENRERFKSEHADAVSTDLMKYMGESWRNLDPKQKQKYIDAANARKGSSPAKKRRSTSASRIASAQEEGEDDNEEEEPQHSEEL